MKRLKRLLTGCLGTVILTAVLAVNCLAAQAKESEDRCMNVVFVLDQSGSMANTDAGALRFEAVELFLGLATETGNYMGGVVFDDTIVLQRDIEKINSKESKNELSAAIRNAVSYGDTDIGKAIELATRMLVTSGNPNLRSSIILLSDGNTDLPKDATGDALKASNQSKQNAITTAREKGIKVHSVCLNANGAAKKEELQEISDATGGTCVEVKSAADLKNVFSQFYNIIYGTETINLADTTIPEGGELEVPFEIPSIGVKEANIIINSLNENTSYNLINPDGYGYIQAEMDDMSIKAKTFTVIKIQKPKAGGWVLKVRGVAGDQVKIDMVYNASLSIELVTDTGITDIAPGETVNFTAKIFNEGSAITDGQIYRDTPITLVAVDTETGTEDTVQTMNVQTDTVTASLTISAEGTYDVRARCVINGLTVSSNTIQIKADSANTAVPVTAAPAAAEKKSLSPMIPGIIIAVILAVIFAILLANLKKKSGGSVIRGRIQFSGYNEGFLGSPVTFDGGKGKMLLSRFLDYSQDVGVDLANTYLKAGEKETYIYLVSKNGYYTDAAPDAKSKKIRLDAETETDISSDMDFGKYLKITYIPDDMGY